MADNRGPGPLSPPSRRAGWFGPSRPPSRMSRLEDSRRDQPRACTREVMSMPKTQLKTAQLGNTELEITRIGFGAWAIGGGGWQFGGDRRRTRSRSPRSTARSSLGSTGSTPQPPTASATRRRSSVARWRVRERAVCVHQVLVAGGSRPTGRVTTSRRDSIRREAEASLRRLERGRDRPLPDPLADPDEDIEEGWSALAEFKDEGLVRHIGVSNFDVEQMRRIQPSRRSRRCSRPTRWSTARSKRRSCRSASRRASA